MNYFGITTYDPLEGSSTSIDPLNSLAISTNLADLIFPGSSGRIWKIRYISALCFLVQCAKTDEEKTFKDNYLSFRRYENVFILASTLLKTDSEDEGLTGLMGTSKAGRLINASVRGGVDISGEILSNQSNLGPLGVHLVILRSLGLIEEKNLILTNAGANLAETFKKNAGDTGEVIREMGAKNRVDLEKLKARLKPIEFSFHLETKKDEAELIFKLLIDNPQRAQLMRDINSFRINSESDLDDEYVRMLNDAKTSNNLKYYKMIYHFEFFQRKLHVFFNYFLIDPIPKPIPSFKEAKEYLVAAKTELINHGSQFKALCQELLGSDAKQFARFNDTLDNLLPRIESFEEFSLYLINDLHGNHQKYKHKAPWVSIEDGLVHKNASTLKNMDSLIESRLHKYRYANVDTILRQLNKVDYK